MTPTTVRMRLSSARAGIVIGASFVVPAVCAAIAVVIDPGFALQYVGLVAALAFGGILTLPWWNRPWRLEIDPGEVRVRSLRHTWAVPVDRLTEAAVVTAVSREMTTEHLYLTFRLPTPGVGPLPRLSPDPGATTLLVRVAHGDGALLARLTERDPDFDVRHPDRRSRRERGGWSVTYGDGPVWALEDVARINPDNDLRELGAGIVTVLAVVVWLGDVMLPFVTGHFPGQH